MLHRILKHLPEAFSATNLRAGVLHVLQEGILNIRLSDGLMHARIKGNLGSLFDVYLDIKTWPKTNARCSCQVQFNCEHAAASLLHLYFRERATNPSFKIEVLDASIKKYTEKALIDNKARKTHEYYYALTILNNSFTVELLRARILKNGILGKKEEVNQIENLAQNNEDAEILKKLTPRGNLLNLTSSSTLELLLSSGRAIDKFSDLPWHRAKKIKAKLAWQVTNEGQQTLAFEHKGKVLEVVRLDKYWYIDKNVPTIGVLELVTQKPPKPFSLDKLSAIELTPTPNITLGCREKAGELSGTARLSFKYKGNSLNFNSPQEYIYKQHNKVIAKILRACTFEKQFFALLRKKLAFVTWQEDGSGEFQLKHENLQQIKNEFTPWLSKINCELILLNTIYKENINAEEVKWYSHIEDQADFFAYELGIIIDNEEVNLLPIIVKLLAKYTREEWQDLPLDHTFDIEIGKNKVLTLAWQRLKPFIDFLFLEKGIFNVDKRLKLKKYQMVVMQEALQALNASLQRQWSNSSLAKGLPDFMHIDTIAKVTLPDFFKADLRDYQLHGLAWLQLLRASKFGGVLADDMGLGKTVQTLAHLCVEKAAKRIQEPVLIVAPLSLLRNWEAEAKRFAPSLKVFIYHGKDRQNAVFNQYDIVITTYSLVQKDKANFIKQHFYYLILDEAQWIKNSRAQITLMVQQIKASYRLCLSGTPFENHLGELWSLMNFIMPGLLFDKKTFKTYFQDPIEKSMNKEVSNNLMARVKPFLLRRSKKDVLQELPSKTTIVRQIQLVDSQRDLYEWIRLSMEKRVRESIMQHGIVRSRMVFLDALLKLRQVCCDPNLLKLNIAAKAQGSSAKLDALLELVASLLEEGRSILIFSQFTSMLAIIEKKIKTKGYKYRMLTGETRNRHEVVEDFQNGKAPIFLMSLKAGGVGLNLTKADTVIHYDPWWNPAVEDQATDRTHRLGQINPVFVYRLVAKSTVEEAMLQMQTKKRSLFEGILSDDKFTQIKMTEEDIAKFFQPLKE